MKLTSSIILLIIINSISCNKVEVKKITAKSENKSQTVRGNHASFYFSDTGLIHLCNAISNNNMTKIEKLVKAGVDLNSTSEEEMSPLLWSMIVPSCNISTYKKLLELGASPNISIGSYHSPLAYATTYKDLDYLKLALKYGGDANLVTKHKEVTPIFSAIRPASMEAIKILAKAGANLNYYNWTGYSILRSALALSYYDVALLLIELGADPLLQDKKGEIIIEFTLKLRYERKHIESKDSILRLKKIIQICKDRGMEIDWDK